MDSIEKALQDLVVAVKNNEAVERVTATITLKRPKPSKADTKAE